MVKIHNKLLLDYKQVKVGYDYWVYSLMSNINECSNWMCFSGLEIYWIYAEKSLFLIQHFHTLLYNLHSGLWLPNTSRIYSVIDEDIVGTFGANSDFLSCPKIFQISVTLTMLDIFTWQPLELIWAKSQTLYVGFEEIFHSLLFYYEHQLSYILFQSRAVYFLFLIN